MTDFFPTASSLASIIDHTNLKAEATQSEIEQLCQEARTFGFATVCVHSSFIPLTSRILSGSKTKPITVVGFPLGANLTEAKASEARLAIESGAQEIDMVIHLGALKSQSYEEVYEDILGVVRAAGEIPVKVIIESAALTSDEIQRACELSLKAKAAFVKTSTGFHSRGGATVEAVALMRKTVGDQAGVKASGGIRSLNDALLMIQAGATRLGTSASAAIVQGLTGGSQSDY